MREPPPPKKKGVFGRPFNYSTRSLINVLGFLCLIFPDNNIKDERASRGVEPPTSLGLMKKTNISEKVRPCQGRNFIIKLYLNRSITGTIEAGEKQNTFPPTSRGHRKEKEN